MVPLRVGPPPVTALIDQFSARYTNPGTKRQYVAELTALFEATGRTHPRLLIESDVLAWAGDRRLANNTIRSRLSRVCTFLRWCVRQGEGDPALVEALMGRDNPLRRTPRLYGKVQGKFPARWLTHDEAFGSLLGACDDGAEVGLRDELVIRLGLAGMRAAEIIHLKAGNLHLTHTPPTIDWMGKASRPRRLVVGRSLADVLRRYLALYEAGVDRQVVADDPLICRGRPGDQGWGRVSWGNRISQTCSVRRLVQLRADAAGLGHLSPHDLRRSAAGILHHATDDGGAHHFDLLDIQKVLGHADPATTMRSYLDPLDTGVIERAAAVLD